jgi:serine/threonine protein kinase
MCETLNRINEKGICHRDLKPVNILYDHTKGKYLISDWGEAKRFVGDP